MERILICLLRILSVILVIIDGINDKARDNEWKTFHRLNDH
jgi:hypothetical protein